MQKSREELEKVILEIVENILDHKNIKIERSFFKLGGDSLKSMRVISKIKQNLKIEVTFKDFFSCKSLNDLVTKVQNKLINKK